MPAIPVTEIELAAQRIRSYVRKTPLIRFDSLSKRTQKEIYLKCETLQHTGSFKIRGAANYILENLVQAKKSGVVAASAGNHAQGVAAMCHFLGIRSSIVMPVHTPAIKTHHTENWGAKVVLFGEVYDESYDHAMELAKKTSAVFIHPFHDVKVMAGQGTIGLELIDEALFAESQVVVVPVGGGGLITGIGSLLKAKRPDIKVIGVTTENAPATYMSFHEQKATEAPVKYTLAEGVAAKRSDEFMLGYLRTVVDDIISVRESDIAHAISVLAEEAKLVVEGAGALAVAAVLSDKIPANKLTLILSGGNIDLPVLSQVLQHGLVEQGRLAHLTIKIPDRPGSLHTITEVLASTRANIMQVFHQRHTRHTSVGETEVEVDIETRGASHTAEIIQKLYERGFEVTQG